MQDVSGASVFTALGVFLSVANEGAGRGAWRAEAEVVFIYERPELFICI